MNKSRKTKIFLTISILTATLFFAGCEKAPTNEKTQESTSVENRETSRDTTNKKTDNPVLIQETETNLSSSESTETETTLSWSDNTTEETKSIKTMIEKRKEELKTETGKEMTEKDIKFLENLLNEMSKK